MRLDRVLSAALLTLALAGCDTGQSVPQTDPAPERPNILLIVADDLGYSDIGAFGGEIETPVLDGLAGEGIRFSRFHVLPTCSPTRAALLSGNDNHVAGMGVMAEFVYPAIADRSGYVGHLADQVATIPEILDSAGYHTYMAGKWHLGEADEQSPHARGFAHTFAMMNGGGSHWADRRPLSPTQGMIYRRNGERLAELPDDFYSSKDYTDALIEQINANKADEKPFFAYLSYTAPHDPLHAPAEYIEKYRGRYDAGWDALARQRLEALKKLGLVPAHVEALQTNPLIAGWDDLSEEERAKYARDMEVYAAMVEYMDMSIGRLLAYLEENGMYDNTLIVFFSDNGANGAHATAYPGNADGTYLASFDNEVGNRGLPGSFVEMGPGWAMASSSPFRLFKSFTTQGGIRSPLIVKPDGSTTAGPAGGGWSHAFLHVTDIMPTFLEVARTAYPKELEGKVLKQPIGLSAMPILSGATKDIRNGEGVGYELFEMKAYLQDEWKLLRLPKPFGSGAWDLYDLADDPGEHHDVSEANPEVKAAMIEAWQDYVERNEVYDHKGRFDELFRKAYSPH